MAGKMLVYFTVMILLAFSASASCYDSDDGPKNLKTPARYLGIDGFVTEGNTTYYDTCVSRKGGSPLDEGNWIREYYCGKNGGVEYEDYFCPGHYYKECLKVHKAAACDDYSGPADFNETSAAANATNTTNATAAANNQANTTSKPINCGDHKVEFGEQCDPPGKICYTKALTQGICDFSCICDPAMTPELFQSLNRSMNDKEANKTAATVTFGLDNASKKTSEAKAEKNTTSKVSGITGAAASDPINDLLKDARKPSEDFSSSFGIRITSAITRAVMSIWELLLNAIGG